MADWKSLFFRLVNLARAEKLITDEGDIVGWATNESGEHYPIHAPTGGGGSSSGGKSASGSGSSKGSIGEKSKNYSVTTPDGTRLRYSSIPGEKDKVYSHSTNEVVEIKGGIKAIKEKASTQGYKFEEYEETPTTPTTENPGRGAGKTGRLYRWGMKNNYRTGYNI